MKGLFELIKDDLISLFETDQIENARKLNENVGKYFFADNFIPMYFSGNYKAKTVFVMLNPGSRIDRGFSFAKSKKSNFATIDNFFNDYIDKHINYGKYDNCRIDNFDLKQAAFLLYFKNSGLDIPNFIEDLKNHDLKLKAKEAVLMNKLQLELIPYHSATFEGLLSNKKEAINNFKLFEPYLNRLLDTISEFERNYVFLGAKQFYYLFQAYHHFYPQSVKFQVNATFKIDGLKMSVNMSLIEIYHNGNIIPAIIPHSFPRRDLPNAYEKMSKYGELCFKEFQDYYQNK